MTRRQRKWAFVAGHVMDESLSRAGNPTSDGTDGKQRTGRSVVGAAQSGLLNQRRRHFNKILSGYLLIWQCGRNGNGFHFHFAIAGHRSTSSTDGPFPRFFLLFFFHNLLLHSVKQIEAINSLNHSLLEQV